MLGLNNLKLLGTNITIMVSVVALKATIKPVWEVYMQSLSSIYRWCWFSFLKDEYTISGLKPTKLAHIYQYPNWSEQLHTCPVLFPGVSGYFLFYFEALTFCSCATLHLLCFLFFFSSPFFHCRLHPDWSHLCLVSVYFILCASIFLCWCVVSSCVTPATVS